MVFVTHFICECCSFTSSHLNAVPRSVRIIYGSMTDTHAPLFGVGYFTPHFCSFVNGHILTKWFMVCCCWDSQSADLASAKHGPWPVQKQFSRDLMHWTRSEPVCQMVGLVAVVWLTTKSNHHSSVHCAAWRSSVTACWSVTVAWLVFSSVSNNWIVFNS